MRTYVRVPDFTGDSMDTAFSVDRVLGDKATFKTKPKTPRVGKANTGGSMWSDLVDRASKKLATG